MASKKIMFQVTCKVQVKYTDVKEQYLHFWVDDIKKIDKLVTDFFSNYNATILHMEIIKIEKN